MKDQHIKDQADYFVSICDHPGAIDSQPYIQLSYQWFTQNPVPETYFRMVFVAGSGFLLQMKSLEPNPLARYMHTDDPVYTDSCMEFFANFYPLLNHGYINFEMNANGAILCQLGACRANRLPVRKLGIEPPKPIATQASEGWNVALTIPLDFINEIYGQSDFAAGSQIQANFYKCGDDLPNPHFGSWHHLGENPTNFHQPETFGVLELKAE